MTALGNSFMQTIRGIMIKDIKTYLINSLSILIQSGYYSHGITQQFGHRISMECGYLKFLQMERSHVCMLVKRRESSSYNE